MATLQFKDDCDSMKAGLREFDSSWTWQANELRAIGWSRDVEMEKRFSSPSVICHSFVLDADVELIECGKSYTESTSSLTCDVIHFFFHLFFTGEDYGIRNIKTKAPDGLITGNSKPEEEFGFYYLSDKPYFHCIIRKTHLARTYQLVTISKSLTIVLPSNMRELLPKALVPVVLTYKNKIWKMIYYGDRKQARFDPNWKYFVRDNNVKMGDGCVFELSECSSECIKFRVQILSGDIPSKFLDRINGKTSDIPIVID
ncbi:hypothetical protein GIB67_042475 [Kingdonia uniflora]|uniref:TF-B3 domain-containing protein n=1 Tax=Kingdonia uniflora TaxID=39325 RepID=A0A7J7M0V9_9MAGN|nr:hypothetical protein GIB67_042475 [Kingdonia uniflora]